MLGLAFLVLPLAGLLLRAPWSTLPQRLTEPGVLAALRLSLLTATLATVVCLLLGVPLAWLLARSGLPMETIHPPAGGRAPGWGAGLAVAHRRAHSDGRPVHGVERRSVA